VIPTYYYYYYYYFIYNFAHSGLVVVVAFRGWFCRASGLFVLLSSRLLSGRRVVAFFVPLRGVRVSVVRWCPTPAARLRSLYFLSVIFSALTWFSLGLFARAISRAYLGALVLYMAAGAPFGWSRFRRFPLFYGLPRAVCSCLRPSHDLSYVVSPSLSAYLLRSSARGLFARFCFSCDAIPSSAVGLLFDTGRPSSSPADS
jgi:hypothetical protein